MIEHFNYIVVEGPIGVGKTSLANKLAFEFECELLLEKPEENPDPAPRRLPSAPSGPASPGTAGPHSSRSVVCPAGAGHGNPAGARGHPGADYPRAPGGPLAALGRNDQRR